MRNRYTMLEKGRIFEALFIIIVILVSIFASAYFFNQYVSVVRAEEVGCCVQKEGLSGYYCQDQTDSEGCSSYVGRSCSEVYECQLGCCIDSEGLPTPNTHRGDCTGVFIEEDPYCETVQLGCCVYGVNAELTTEQRCVDILHGSWHGDITDQIECFSQIEGADRGTCRLATRCAYVTQEECEELGGFDFVPGLKPIDDPNCNCEIVDDKGKCIDGLQHVYEYDTCGNVYPDRIRNECNSDEWCIDDECQSTDCTNVYDNWNESNQGFTGKPGNHGKTRHHGESWCVYDIPDRTFYYTPIGGLDPVGSEHWLAKCLYGKVYVSPPPQPYRQYICFETLIDADTGEIAKEDGTPIMRDKRYKNNNYRSFAFWVLNPWRECYLIQDEEQCREHPWCYWVTDLNYSAGFLTEDKDNDIAKWFGIKDESLEKITGFPGSEILGIDEIAAPVRCLPRVAPGFDENGKVLCDLATVQCTLEDRLIGDTNPECDDAPWIELMAQRCRAMGDCGPNMNWLGKVSDPAWENSILAAEINPEKDDAGNIIGKDIEGLWDLKEGDDFKKIQASAGERGWGRKIATGVGKFLLVPAGWLAGVASVVVEAVAIANIPFAAFNKGFLWKSLSFSTTGAIVAVAGLIVYLVGCYLTNHGWRVVGETLKSIGVGMMAGGLAVALGASGPVGWAVGIAAAVIYAVFFATWDVDHVVVKCAGWVPPYSGEDCSKCNDDPYRPCSKYRCESLGAACKFVNEVGGIPLADSDAVCVSEENDGQPPYIVEISAEDDVGNSLDVSPSTTSGPTTINVQASDGGDLDPGVPVILHMKFNERVLCKWDITEKDSMEDMAFSVDGRFSNEKTLLLGTSPLRVNQQVFLRCADVYGNENSASYIIKFDVKDVSYDIFPPRILATNPPDGAYIGFDKNKIDVLVYLNRPAECKWANSDMSYDDMTTEKCTTEPAMAGLICNLTNVDVSSEINNIYIRCKSSDAGETAPTSLKVITLRKAPPIQIVNIEPNDTTVYLGPDNMAVELTVHTAGGIDNTGTSVCYYLTDSDKVPFDTTGTNLHKTLVPVEEGKNDITVSCCLYSSCVDAHAVFNVQLDTVPPKIKAIYKEDNKLIVKTDEIAECKYSTESCEAVANGETMVTSLGLVHSISLSTGMDTYYIQCKDKYNNQGECVSVKVV